MALTLRTGFTIGPGVKLLGSVPTSYPTDGLVLFLDAANYSGTGTTWLDSSPAHNDATLSGDTPWTAGGAQSYFTFNSGIATAPAILPNDGYTKAGVFRVSGLFVNFISGGQSGDDHAFWGALTDHLQAGHNGSWYTVTSTDPVPTNQWVFGAVTFNTSTGWRLYVNTQTPATSSDTSTFSVTPAIVEVGGYQGNGNNLNGDVATAMVYNRALSDEEIAQLYAYYQARFGL